MTHPKSRIGGWLDAELNSENPTIGQTDRVNKSAMGTPLHLPLFSNPRAVNAPFPKQCSSSTSFRPNPLVQTMHLPTGHGLYERICTKASAPHAIAKRIDQKNGARELHIPSLPPWRIRRPLPSHSPPPPSSSLILWLATISIAC